MLLERDVELRTLQAALVEASAGRGGVVVVEGVPGIGKTALLTAGETAAADRGFRVLRASGGEYERSFGFGLARQLFERWLREAPAPVRRAVVRGAAVDALPALGQVGGEPVGEDAGVRGLHGLYWLAANLAGREPLLLVCDDLHWADPPSLRWLIFLSRRLEGQRLLLLAGTRSAEPGAPQDLLAMLAREHSVAVLRPVPLSESAVAQVAAGVLGTALDSRFATACTRATGGNPLLVHALLQEVVDAGAGPDAVPAEGVPSFSLERVGRVVRGRLAGLGETCGAVARAAAVLADQASTSRIAALTGLSLPEVTSAVGALVGRGVLTADGKLTFPHPVVRAAVVQGMTHVERSVLHARAARRLEAEGREADTVAGHLDNTEPAADPWVVATLRAAAASAAARGAPEAAARMLERALAEPPPPSERSAVLLALGAAEATAGASTFDSHLVTAIRDTDDPALLAQAALTLAEARANTMRFADAFDVVTEATARVEPGSVPAQRLEAFGLWLAHFDHGLLPRARPLATARLAALDRDAVFEPELAAALAIWLHAHHPPSARAARLIDATIARGGLDADGLYMVSFAQMLSGFDRLAQADRMHAEAAECARRRGAVGRMALYGALRSEVSLLGGAVRDAEAQAEQSWEVLGAFATSLVVSPVLRAWVASALVAARVARGALDSAADVVESVPRFETELQSWGAELFLLARAALREAQGRLPEAIEDTRAAGRALHPDHRNPTLNRWRGRLAMLLAAAGEQAEARRLAAAELADARCFAEPLSIGIALTAHGLAQGGSSGLAALEEAVGVLAPTGYRLHHARALLELGAAQRRSGARVTARQTLREALDLAGRCDARVLADRARDELVTAGGRVRQGRQFVSGPESLTAAEHRVAVLVAEGLTNRQVAERLYVTQAAVQWHLRSIFRKLEITSRTQLAAALHAKPSPAQGSDLLTSDA